jgi:branched-chain amino acid transport system permease protein
MEYSGKALAISAIIVVLLILFPAVAGSDHTLNLFISLFITFTLAQSWNVLAGYAGQLSLGNATFFGVGTMVFHFFAWRIGLPFYIALPAAGFASVILASFIGVPALQLRGVYFAIGTLALAEVFRATIANLLPLTVYIPAAEVGNYKLSSRYYLALMVALLAQAAAYCLIKSKIGFAMRAIRDDCEAADASGVNPFKYKFMALVFSSFFSGLAGAVFAYYQTSIVPSFPFSPQWTFEPLVAACVGGAGALLGPLVGSVFLIILQEVFALALGKGYLIIFGALFVFVVLFFPGGLIWALNRMRKKLYDLTFSSTMHTTSQDYEEGRR